MKDFDIYLRNRITEIDVIVRSLSVRNDISVRHKLRHIVEDIATKVEKFARTYTLYYENLLTHNELALCTRDGEEIVAVNKFADFYLRSSDVGTTKASFESVHSVSELISRLDSVFAFKVTGNIENKLVLESSDITLVQEWFYACSELCNTLVSADNVDTIRTMYAGGSTSSQLVTEMTGPGAVSKTVGTSGNLIELAAAVLATLEYLVGASHNMLTMSSAVNVVLTRYRLLQEMDADAESGVELTLADFDDMTLEDIYFVITG